MHGNAGKCLQGSLSQLVNLGFFFKLAMGQTNLDHVRVCVCYTIG